MFNYESESDSESDDGPGDALEECKREMCHIIGSLYQISVAFRTATHSDTMLKASNIDMSHLKQLDVDYIDYIFPTIPGFLKERLGNANTKRRQLLKYHRDQVNTSREPFHCQSCGKTIQVSDDSDWKYEAHYEILDRS